MARQLYKATQLLRATVRRECRLVLPAELNAPPGSYRLVQVLTPMPLFIGFEDTAPEETAGGRDYLMAAVPGGFGTLAPFAMTPEQGLYAMAASTPGADQSSLVFATLIVQFWMEN